jgi:glycerol-3-phosphate dehydrogenase
LIRGKLLDMTGTKAGGPIDCLIVGGGINGAGIAEGGAGRSALLSAFGGKTTTCKLAGQALEKLLPLLGRPAGTGRTAHAPLPARRHARQGPFRRRTDSYNYVQITTGKRRKK